MTRLVIFDLDGTLLNTIEDLAAACNHALRGCGCPERKPEEYNMMVGRGIYNLFRAALPEGKKTDEMVWKMSELFVLYYDSHKCDLTRPYPGIVGMLGKLSAAKVKMAVASNKYQSGAESIVASYFGQFGFVRILGQRDGRPIKPSPEIVEEIMSEVEGISRDEVIYVGDSDVDMLTGKNAGVRTVGVTWGFRTREELLAHEPWKLADTPEELASLILHRTDTGMDSGNPDM